MELFKPSREVLEMICESKKDLIFSHEIFTFSSLNNMHELLSLYCSGLFEKIIHFYRDEGIALDEKSKRRLNYQGVYNVIGESFKNWVDHAPENSNLLAGSFFGSKGICYGFQDGGDFFKTPKIKKQLENKVYFKEFDSNSRGDNCRSGFNQHIFPCSDFIEVDSKKGVLYCVQLKKNIIAPEGEHGSAYFDKLRKEKGIINE